MAYQLRGMARCELGDEGGLEDLGEALQIAFHLGLAFETARSRTYLGESTWQLEGPARGIVFYERAAEECLQRGLSSQAMRASGESVWMLYDLGEWDRVLARAGEVEAWDALHGSGSLRVIVVPYKVRVLLHRGLAGDVAPEDVESAVRLARQFKDLQTLAPALTAAAVVAVEAGDVDRAVELLEEFHAATVARSGLYREAHLPDLVEACIRIDRLPLADTLIQGAEGIAPRQRHCVTSARGLLAAAQGEHEEALELFRLAREGWDAFGVPFERARADLGAALALEGLDRQEEAARSLGSARETFEQLRAAPWAARASAA